MYLATKVPLPGLRNFFIIYDSLALFIFHLSAIPVSSRPLLIDYITFLSSENLVIVMGMSFGGHQLLVSTQYL